MVGVKWTTASNLVVRARASFSMVPIAVLEAVCGTIIDDHRVIKDIIRNTRWSRVDVSHIYSGKEPNSAPHSVQTLREELAAQNPAYAALTIQQPSTWVQDPVSFTNGQLSSVTFAFDNPDGSIFWRLVGSSLTAFGNPRCAVKPWKRVNKAANVQTTDLAPPRSTHTNASS